jgi:hypothetical protein
MWVLMASESNTEIIRPKGSVLQSVEGVRWVLLLWIDQKQVAKQRASVRIVRRRIWDSPNNAAMIVGDVVPECRIVFGPDERGIAVLTPFDGVGVLVGDRS